MPSHSIGIASSYEIDANIASHRVRGLDAEAMLMLPALPATDSHTFSDTETIKFHDVDTSLTL
jgi:hypothetical protein